MTYCDNCDNEAVGYYVTDKGALFKLCHSCQEAFELGQGNPEKEVFPLDDEG